MDRSQPGYHRPTTLAKVIAFICFAIRGISPKHDWLHDFEWGHAWLPRPNKKG